jgi:hypothetical protein
MPFGITRSQHFFGGALCGLAVCHRLRQLAADTLEFQRMLGFLGLFASLCCVACRFCARLDFMQGAFESMRANSQNARLFCIRQTSKKLLRLPLALPCERSDFQEFGRVEITVVTDDALARGIARGVDICHGRCATA